MQTILVYRKQETCLVFLQNNKKVKSFFLIDYQDAV